MHSDGCHAADAEALEALADAIRMAFGTLGELATDLHASTGITAPMRAVMQFLEEVGPATMPAIALAKRHSRQAVREIVGSLLLAGIAECRDNPMHQRSKLIALSAEGKALFSAMRCREKQILQHLASKMQDAPLLETARVLKTLSETVQHLDFCDVG